MAVADKWVENHDVKCSFSSSCQICTGSGRLVITPSDTSLRLDSLELCGVCPFLNNASVSSV